MMRSLSLSLSLFISNIRHIELMVIFSGVYSLRRHKYSLTHTHKKSRFKIFDKLQK